MKTLGIYLHIPFCMRKCKYCDFLSFDNCTDKMKERYKDALLREITFAAENLSCGKEADNNGEETYIVDTVFIGGGTPSLLPEEYIAEIVESVKNKFNTSINAEITIEVNPGTVDAEKLEIYRKAGINRLSIGVQSLNDECLKKLGRIHTAEEFKKTYFAAREVGFDNISMDLMFAIPGQDEAIWEATVREAISLKPDHISFYSLQLEEGTEFFEMYRKGTLIIADDESDRRMYHNAVKLLKEAGYKHYEISNAALPGRESRHNMKYWTFDDYLGLGLGASSFIHGRRIVNTDDFEGYIESFEKGAVPENCKALVLLENETDCTAYNLKQKNESVVLNSEADSVFEYIFTGLRRLDGINLNDFEKRFGRSLYDYYPHKREYIEKMVADGYMFVTSSEVQCDADGNGNNKLSEEVRLGLTLKGIDISNGIMSEFAEPEI